MPRGFIVTDKGRELIDIAIATETKLELTTKCFGDGGDDSLEQFDYGIRDLAHSICEVPLSPETDTYGVDPNDPTSLYIKSILPDDVTGTINEIGYKDKNGNLIIYGLPMPRTKVAGTHGEGLVFVYENWITLANGDLEHIEINIKSPEWEEIEKELKKKVDAKDGYELISTEQLDQIEKNRQGVKKNADDILTIKAQIADGVGMPLSFLIKGSESFEGHEVTATSKIDKSEFKKKIIDGQCVIKVKLPGEYVITNTYNDTTITASVGEPLLDEVYFTDFYGSINVTVPEIFIGETLEATNGEHTVEQEIKGTLEVLSVFYKGDWQVGIKGTEYVKKASVTLNDKGGSATCSLSTDGIPYITVTVCEELQDEKIKCKKDDFERVKEVKEGQVQFFVPVQGTYEITPADTELIKESVSVAEAQEYQCSLDLEDLSVPVLIVTSKEEDNGKTIKVSKDFTELEKVLINRKALFVLPEQGTWVIKCDSYPDNVKQKECTENKVYRIPFRATVFGIRVKQAESDPQKRIEVLEDTDLYGLKPITSNLQEQTVDFGDMEETFLFKAFNNPCLLSIDGTEEILLDPYDYTKKLDGGYAPTVDKNSNYNALVRVNKIYTYQYNQSGYEYYFMSDEQVDENYTAVGFTREDGSEADCVYRSMYLGCFDDQNRLRSLPSVNIRVNTPIKDFITAVKKLGDGYYLEQVQVQNLYEVSWLMMVQTFNCKEVLRSGRHAGHPGNYYQPDGYIKTGLATTSGPMKVAEEYFQTKTDNVMKYMHIEDFWGYGHNDRFIEGIINANNKAYIKMKPPYIFASSDSLSSYVAIDDFASQQDYNNGFVRASNVSNKYGRYPTMLEGSESTYECNTYYIKNNTGSYVDCYSLGNNGLFDRSATTFDNGGYDGRSACITYIPPTK